MSNNSSPLPSHLVVELVGPLVDDEGALARTIERVLTHAGVELRPGALDQVAGASARWGVQTLLEGHGREDLLEEAEQMIGRIARQWKDEASRARASAGAAVGWQRLRSAAHQVAVLSAWPEDVSEGLLAAAGLEALLPSVLDASGDAGPPRAEVLGGAFARWGVEPSRVTAVVSSAPAMLAALTARCGAVILCGSRSAQAAMLAEHRVATLADVGR